MIPRGTWSVSFLLLLLLLLVKGSEEYDDYSHEDFEDDHYDPFFYRREANKILPGKELVAQVGHQINISCLGQVNGHLHMCVFERLHSPNGRRYNVYVSGVNDVQVSGEDQELCKCTYEYAGRGLESGDCTLTIQNVTQFHLARWKCFLHNKDGGPILREGNFTYSEKVSEPEPLPEPYFLNPQIFQELVYNFSAPETTNVTCCTDVSDPDVPFTLNIYLADGANESKTTFRTDGGLALRGSRACRTASFTFQPEDNGRCIVCNLTYGMSPSEKHELTASHPLQVKYPPKFLSDEPSQEVTSDNRLLLGISFISNPEPCVTWHVITDEENDVSFQISDHHIMYKPSMNHIAGNMYTANLTILNFHAEDELKLKLKVNASNAIGSSVHRITIISPAPGEESRAFWKMVIIGVGAILLLIFIALVVYVVIDNKRKFGEYELGRTRPTTEESQSQSSNRRTTRTGEKTTIEEETEPVDMESSV